MNVREQIQKATELKRLFKRLFGWDDRVKSVEVVMTDSGPVIRMELNHQRVLDQFEVVVPSVLEGVRVELKVHSL